MTGAVRASLTAGQALLPQLVPGAHPERRDLNASLVQTGMLADWAQAIYAMAATWFRSVSSAASLGFQVGLDDPGWRWFRGLLPAALARCLKDRYIWQQQAHSGTTLDLAVLLGGWWRCCRSTLGTCRTSARRAGLYDAFGSGGGHDGAGGSLSAGAPASRCCLRFRVCVYLVFWLSQPVVVACRTGATKLDMVSAIVRQTRQIATPDRMRGRVSAVTVLFIGRPMKWAA
jgi:hypothetical protein